MGLKRKRKRKIRDYLQLQDIKDHRLNRAKTIPKKRRADIEFKEP